MPSNPNSDHDFWEKVRKSDGCWIWTGSSAGGYGRMRMAGVTIRAHKYSFECHNGAVPHGMCVMHSCDIPLCVNPAHLSLGTNADNIADKVAKGRHSRGRSHAAAILPNRPRGFGNPSATLCDGDSIVVQMLIGSRIDSQWNIARAFGTTQTTVSNIKIGKGRFAAAKVLESKEEVTNG